jgi:DprA winged helix domain
VAVGAAARRLHAGMAGEPATLDELVGRCGLPVGEAAGLIRELERAGRMERARGLLWPC